MGWVGGDKNSLTEDTAFRRPVGAEKAVTGCDGVCSQGVVKDRDRPTEDFKLEGAMEVKIRVLDSSRPM